MTNDVEVINHGSVIAIAPLTEAAHEWMGANLALEPWQWIGGAAMVEPRSIEAILDGMAEDGLEVTAHA